MKPLLAKDGKVRWEWIWRALFESALILFGILGAFAVNEWQAARDRQARVDSVMTAVRAELESNLQLLREASEYNFEVVGALQALGAQNATSVPGEVYPRGLLLRPQLVSAAWDSAEGVGVVNELPLDTVLILAAAYDNQRDYLDATANLLNSFYGAAINSAPSMFSRPGSLGNLLNDFARRGRGLINRYEDTLARLNSPAS
jgi:hypothetical protein